MGLLNLLSLLRRRERLAKLARRIAERSLDEVARRVVGLDPASSTAETRGYIRARAAVVIYREVHAALARERHVAFADRARLIRMATDEVVNTMAAQTALFRARQFQVAAA